MTNKELQKELKKYPDEAEIAFDEGAVFYDINEIEFSHANSCPNSPWITLLGRKML